MGASKRLTTALSLAVILSVSTFSGVASAAEDDVEFVGSGWGHGVGMSQYGALAMATTGTGYQAILAHYYQGTTIQSVHANTKLWVNLERNFSAKTLSVIGISASPTDVSITSDSGSLTANPGATISIVSAGPNGCVVNVTNPAQPVQSIIDQVDCAVDFNWYSWNVPGENPATKIEIAGCSLADWNTPGGTVFRPCQYARGQFHLRHGSGGLDLSAEMLLDDYVLGISEMPYPWGVEALKVQAVAARSYAEGRRISRGMPTSSDDNGCWCHVKDTTADQRYVGWGHYHANGYWITASNATKRQVITHEDSNLGPLGVVTAFYSSSTGGATEFGHVVGYASSAVEWLSSVNDSWAIDGTVWNPNASWTKVVSASSVAQAVGIDFLSRVVVSKTRPGSGSTSEVRFEGIDNGQPVTVYKTGPWVQQSFGMKSQYFLVDYQAPSSSELDPSGDEILLYKSNGTFQYNSVLSDGGLGAKIHSGSNYTTNWKSISAIDLDGDGQDEIMFYRDDGLYRYYEIGTTGHVGLPIQAGSEYTPGWDSIAAVDLDGDGQDEIFFYREDGLYRYYNIKSNGTIGLPLASGSEYTHGWDSISAVDLDGDGQDEMFFYRSDGLYRYYNIRPDGTLPLPMLSGNNYPSGWDTITAVDLDGDGQDEMLFYKENGEYEFFDLSPSGALSGPLDSGSNFGSGWSVIAPLNLDGQ